MLTLKRFGVVATLLGSTILLAGCGAELVAAAIAPAAIATFAVSGSGSSPNLLNGGGGRPADFTIVDQSGKSTQMAPLPPGIKSAGILVFNDDDLDFSRMLADKGRFAVVNVKPGTDLAAICATSTQSDALFYTHDRGRSGQIHTLDLFAYMCHEHKVMWQRTFSFTGEIDPNVHRQLNQAFAAQIDLAAEPQQQATR